VKPGTLTPDADLVNAVIARAQQQGVLMLSAGLYGNVVRFLPSLQLTDELIELVVRVIDEALIAEGA